MAGQDLERRRREDSRNRENRARLAFAYARWESDGLGSTTFEDAADFALTFIEQPYVTSGHQIDIDALAESLGMDTDDPALPIPHVTSYIVDWNQDSRGFYVGAFAACSVTFGTTLIAIPEDLVVTIQHHLTFSAIAIKDIPLTDDGD